jgi:hypothetical protein
VTAPVVSAMLARKVAVELGQPVDIFWHEGVALGASCVRGLGKSWQANAVLVIADAKATAPRASNPIGALANCYSLDLAVRCAVAHGAGILLGWAAATVGRADRTECGTCGAAICTDVEQHWTCQGGLHEVVACDLTCAKALGCGGAPECHGWEDR